MAAELDVAVRATAARAESVRMKRMAQTIKKALDVSVSSASSVNLRAFFEDECKDEPELLAQLFAAAASTAARDSNSVSEQEQVAGELGAQALQTLRQKIEAAFHELCARHQINEQLVELEEAIDEAQRAKIQEQASKELEEAKRKETEEQAGGLVDAARTAPEELVRAEQIRVMEAEKKQLELLVKQLQMKKEEQKTRLDIKRELATNAIEDLQQVTQSVQEATAFVKDYARSSTTTSN